MSSSTPIQNSLPEGDDDDEELLNEDDADEEIPQEDDHPMEVEDDAEDDIQEEIQFQNDSIAHFDSHTDSIFCIAQHPLQPSLIVTGGGDDVAYLFDSSVADEDPRPLLPTSYESNPQPKGERKSMPPLQKLDGHTDSVNAVAFTEPSGEYIVTAGLDGKLRAWSRSSPDPSQATAPSYAFLSESSEVQEINWLSPCPSPNHPNTLAFGANDGSVWVYTINAADTASPLTITQAYYLHTESCTAGAWTPDGNLLATVSEDSSFYVYDVWGEAAHAGITAPGAGQAIVSLTASDQRFAVDGGLFSVAISPGATIAAVGGAGGNIRIVALPRLGAVASTLPSSSSSSQKPTATKPRSSRPGPTTTTTASATANPLLASLGPQSDSIETLSFSAPPLTLLAAGSVDGSIALFDVAHRFALRRHIGEAHGGEAVVKLSFGGRKQGGGGGAGGGSGGGGGHLLVSAGMDGVVRLWDARGGGTGGAVPVGAKKGEVQTQGQGQGFVKEWRGHKGEGEGGGVLGFVMEGSGSSTTSGKGERIITAGDDGVALVFEMGV